MAGSNVVFNEGQNLFSEGEPADGMYLIRKGELVVYLVKDSHEVQLAKIGPGGMIGEMAFFDQKPRSASVKATTPTEVTKITAEDFAKLMKQIPKWFVAIMSSLSTRLRETNERLQKLENVQAGAKAPFEDSQRILHVINLLMKDAIKDGKVWTIDRDKTEETVAEVFGLEKKKVNEINTVFIKEKLFVNKNDTYNNSQLGIIGKNQIGLLARFIGTFVKSNPGKFGMPDSGIQMLEIVVKLALESAYETINIPIEDVILEGERQSLITSDWKEHLPLLKTPSDSLSLVKVSSGVGFKVDKKTIDMFLKFHRILNALHKAALS